ncbi:Glutathione S-transferase-like protein [Lachnellula occidentalis]|uniref:Glutathione S-transferase-like protein n=1 Tax=Lachnellula occidentalis TaxID=215460 RepID=A0A8H8U9Z3_9HELO|nr:Glutathione S-transferase-like protein [Lachnellula occidentalis]
MSKLTLYDLPSKGRCSCWSLNPWKTRLALNFKNIDYKTEWTEYPDIASRLSPHFPTAPISWNPKPSPSVSKKDHPTPPLHLDSPLLPKVQALLPKIMPPLSPVWQPAVPTNLLNPASKEFFERTRAERLGKPLAQIAQESGGEEAWMAALPGIKELGALVKAEGGPFVMGKTPSYADFVIVGWLRFFKVIDEKLYERVVSIEPAFGTLYDASKQWLERDDH